MVVGARQKSKDTGPELRLRRTLGLEGLRGYRVHQRIELGRWRNRSHHTTPDVVFTRHLLAVYVDGCYFHSCPTHIRHKGQTPEWRAKMAKARARDQRHSRALAALGWRVLRIWECESPEAGARACKAIIETEADPGIYGIGKP